MCNFNFIIVPDSMVNRIETLKSYLVEKENVRTSLSQTYSRVNSIETSDFSDIMIAEGGEGLYNYAKWLGLANDNNLIVLSSLRHYYYDEDELKNVRTVINLKLLNLIKNIGAFLQSTYNIMPPESNFIGCFAENKPLLKYFVNDSSSSNSLNGHTEALEQGIVSTIPFLNLIYSFIDSKTNRYLTRRNVNLLFEAHGFRILDMVELNHLTYFHAQKVRISTE
jgi:hypothetical protein